MSLCAPQNRNPLEGSNHLLLFRNTYAQTRGAFKMHINDDTTHGGSVCVYVMLMLNYKILHIFVIVVVFYNTK